MTPCDYNYVRQLPVVQVELNSKKKILKMRKRRHEEFIGMGDVIGGVGAPVVVKKEVVDKAALDTVKLLKSRRMNDLYHITRIKMMLLSGFILSEKTFLFPPKLLQELIFAVRDLSDAYHQDIPGSQRLSNGTQLLVVDSDNKNIVDCSIYLHKQLYPLVQRKQYYDDSLMCHYECVLDLFDGKA